MPDYRSNSVGIRFAQSHAILCLTHFTGSHHLHCAGDFLSVFNTRNLGSYFFSAGHCLICSLGAFNYFLPGLSCLKLLKGGLKLGFNVIIVVAGFVDLTNQIAVFTVHVGQ